MKRENLLLALGIGLLMAVLSRATLAADNAFQVDAPEAGPAPDSVSPDLMYENTDETGTIDSSNPVAIVPTIDSLPFTPQSPNLKALLFAIRSAEHGSAVPDNDRYFRLYGGAPFSNTTDHPALTGWLGERLPDQWCINAGLRPGCVSTAAGAYQINKPTWNEFRRDKGDGYGYLNSFSPDAQDAAALRILVYTGAAQAIDAGNLQRALQLASERWASLPNSTAGQHLQSETQIAAWYESAGGSYA